MARTVTYLVELAVGLGCLAGAVAAWRVPRVRWVAAVLAVAGLTAVAHSIVELAN
jgi:hypothetical protein